MRYFQEIATRYKNKIEVNFTILEVLNCRIRKDFAGVRVKKTLKYAKQEPYVVYETFFFNINKLDKDYHKVNEIIFSEDFTYKDCIDPKKEIIAKFNKKLTLGDLSFEQKDYPQALSIYSELLKQNLSTEYLKAQIKKCTELIDFNSYLTRADEFFSEKKYTEALSYYEYIVLIYSNLANSTIYQKIELCKTKIKENNSFISFDLGIDGTLSPFNIKANNPNDIPVTYSETGLDTINISYAAVGITLKFYSPKSLIGASIGAKYSCSTLSILDKSKINFDYFSISKVEIPVNLMLRFGKINSKLKKIVSIGGTYNLPVKGSRTMNSRTLGTSTYKVNSIDNSIDQFKPYFSLSASLGLELKNKKNNNSRASIYIDCDYPLGNTLNTDYKEFKSGGNSTLANFDNAQIAQFRIGLGLRYSFGFLKL